LFLCVPAGKDEIHLEEVTTNFFRVLRNSLFINRTFVAIHYEQQADSSDKQ